MKKITLSVVALTMTMMSYSQTQCKEVTKSNIQCKNVTKKVNSLCHNHDSNHKIKSDTETVICKGNTKKNTKCKSKTKNTSGLCHNHQPKKK